MSAEGTGGEKDDMLWQEEDVKTRGTQRGYMAPRWLIAEVVMALTGTCGGRETCEVEKAALAKAQKYGLLQE